MISNMKDDSGEHFSMKSHPPEGFDFTKSNNGTELVVWSCEVIRTKQQGNRLSSQRERESRLDGTMTQADCSGVRRSYLTLNKSSRHCKEEGFWF